MTLVNSRQSVDLTTQQADISVQQKGNFNSRSVIVVDSNKKVEDFKAGVGPGMFDGLGRAFVTLACLFAAAVATASVGIATGQIKKAAITFGALTAGAIFVNLYLKAKDPRC